MDYTGYLMEHAYNELKANETLYIQYEADRDPTSLVIHFPDTDVLVLLVLLLHHYQSIGTPYIYMSTGRVP